MESESKNKKNGTLNRRDFLKALTAISGAAVISSGCTPEPLDKLVSYAVPPENVIPGLANYYSTAIPNSPAGSSVVVKVREGRAIKIEEIVLIQSLRVPHQLKIKQHYKPFMIQIE